MKRKLWVNKKQKVFVVKLDNGSKQVVYFDKNGTAHTVTK